MTDTAAAPPPPPPPAAAAATGGAAAASADDEDMDTGEGLSRIDKHKQASPPAWPRGAASAAQHPRPPPAMTGRRRGWQSPSCSATQGGAGRRASRRHRHSAGPRPHALRRASSATSAGWCPAHRCQQQPRRPSWRQRRRRQRQRRPRLCPCPRHLQRRRRRQRLLSAQRQQAGVVAAGPQRCPSRRLHPAPHRRSPLLLQRTPRWTRAAPPCMRCDPLQ